MATILEDDFSTGDNWTTVETTGTVTFNTSFQGKTCVALNNGSNSFDTCGFYNATPITMQAGHVIYYKVYLTFQNHACYTGFTDSASLNMLAPADSTYLNQRGTSNNWAARPGSDNAVGTNVNNTWWEVALECDATNEMKVYIKEEGDETWIDTALTSGSTDLTDVPIYFYAQQYGETYTTHLAEFYWTDDGTIGGGGAITPSNSYKKIISQGQG